MAVQDFITKETINHVNEPLINKFKFMGADVECVQFSFPDIHVFINGNYYNIMIYDIKMPCKWGADWKLFAEFLEFFEQWYLTMVEFGAEDPLNLG